MKVERLDVPVVARGDSKDRAKTCYLGNRRACVEVIDPIDLRESTGDQARLALDGVVRIALNLEDPLCVPGRSQVSISLSMATFQRGPTEYARLATWNLCRCPGWRRR